MRLEVFTETFECTSRAHCVACRDSKPAGQRWREQMAKAGLSVPEICPFGKPIDYVPSAEELAAASDPASPAVAMPAGDGPGTELKKLLARIGIVPGPGCKCNAMAARMNREGEQWCLDHVDEILAVMREEAERRGLPFVGLAGRLLIKHAIGRARKIAARKVRSCGCSPDDKCCERSQPQ